MITAPSARWICSVAILLAHALSTNASEVPTISTEPASVDRGPANSATPPPTIDQPPSAPPKPAPDSEVQFVGRSTNQFAADLYARLATQDGNLFLSPASIETALAMLSAGAHGRTEQQMSSTLHLALPGDKLHPAFAQLLRRWNGENVPVDAPSPAGSQKPGDNPQPSPTTQPERLYELAAANSLWVQQEFALRPEFVGLSQQSYDAAVQTVDFGAGDFARQAINSWIAKRTRGKIPELVAAGSLSKDTRLILTNAIYFKGNWGSPFDAARTTPQSFQKSATDKLQVAMMNQQGTFKYFEQNGFQAIELPFAGGDLSMVVLISSKIDGLTELTKRLTAENLTTWIDHLSSETVNVSLPRFKLSSQFQLSQTLASLGMTDAFSTGADFSGISMDEGLQLSEVLHQATVDVNEAGMEAAAATGVVAVARSARVSTPKEFKADHPFVFLIHDRVSGAILFLGRLENPQPAETPPANPGGTDR